MGASPPLPGLPASARDMIRTGRTRAALLAGKTARAAARRLGHGGTALPGLVAERVDPDLIRALGAQLECSVLITGTNGKTTTARLLASILQEAGRAVVHNRAGSNLIRGLTAALVEAAGKDGRLPRSAVGVFEVDEATLPSAAAATPPQVLVINNLLRDQLDRYGEIDAIRERWQHAIRSLPAATTVALNADDPLVATLADDARGPVCFFGIDDELESVDDHAAEAHWHPETGAEFVYDRLFYAHLGHWRYGDDGRCRPDPEVRARAVAQSADGVTFLLEMGEASTQVGLPLAGLYNVYNALAAATAASVLGADLGSITPALAGARAAFGRQECLNSDGHVVRILLGKNPAGLNEALRTLQGRDDALHLLVLLNDGLADGRDVSWIWDTEWEALAPRVESVVVGGSRAADMALRLEYAGFPVPRARHADIERALDRALAGLPDGAELTVLPTYTALLDVRARLSERAGAPPIWEEA